ncbi:hypothetical protein MNBD_GAMMA17-677 [hydrothermal vent metagenome]|uniref:Uncharacterized protein n=1 Tax=hydrothermal vent metagenome TaxID=652676 RepID=A0A3B0ZQI9_9ZZZZ
MNVAIYCIGAALIIALLIKLSSGAVSSGMGLVVAILLVIVLPCFLAMRIVKKERADREEEEAGK